jgi:hypothetical protein
VSQLTVSINNDGLHSIAAPEAFETTEPFDLVLNNDGEAVHVHLNLDETLSAVADIRANNHYVEPTGSRPVGIDVNPRTAAVTGRLKIATGYGSEVAYTRITVQPPEADPTQVTVDKSLANPQREAPTEPTAAERIDTFLAEKGGSGLLIAFGLVAVLVTIVVAATLDSGVVIAGAVVVLLGVIVAVSVAVGG